MNAFTQKTALTPPAPLTTPAAISAQIPGNCVLFLADGTTLVGVVTAVGARKQIGKKDDAGNDVYDVDWSIQSGTVRKD